MMKMPRTEKVSLKIQSISASSFKFKAQGRKCFATIHYRIAVINRDDRQCPTEHRASHRLQTNVSALAFKWFMPLVVEKEQRHFWNLHCRVFASVQLLGKGDPAMLQSQHLEGQAVEPVMIQSLSQSCFPG